MRIVLQNARLAFAKIYEAEAFPGGKDPTKYFSAAFIIPPDHPQMGEIRAGIKAVAAKKFPTNTGAMLQAAELAGKLCLRDGATKPDLEGYAGNWFISARTKETAGKIAIYGLGGVNAGEVHQGQPGAPYGGCYVRAILTLFAYGGQPGIPKGVGAGLGSIQFMRDGDAFSGGAAKATADEFGDISAPIGANDDSAAAPAATGTGGNPWD